MRIIFVNVPGSDLYFLKFVHKKGMNARDGI